MNQKQIEPVKESVECFVEQVHKSEKKKSLADRV